jgi:hypothetical protein
LYDCANASIHAALRAKRTLRKHLAAIPPDTPEASAAAKIKRQYDVEKRRQSEQAARAQEAQAQPEPYSIKLHSVAFAVI